MPGTDAWVVLAIVIAAFAVLRWLERRWGHRFGEADPCEDRITALRMEMEHQRFLDQQRIRELEEGRARDAERIAELTRRVDFLVSQLQVAGDMRSRPDSPPVGDPAPASPLPPKPLLLVCGPDPAMCELDRNALRRAGVIFQRLGNATRASISGELRRRRQAGTLYPWLHIAAHADARGVALADGIAGPEWWAGELDGVRVVLLAACQTEMVADALAGLVTVVFVSNAEIENRDAADFTYAFWRRMREHGDPVRSYQQAISEVPQVAEFTDIRVS